MLEKLLQIVAEGGAHSDEELTRRLSVPQPLLEAMLADLSRLGYLQAVSGGCQGQCAGCPLSSCVAGAGRLWALTEKGRQAAARLRLK